MNNNREEHKMLALSTGHLTERTWDCLDNNEHVDSVVYYPKGDFGWFVHVPEKGLDLEECKERCPRDLFRCISFASENGYDWIMFDRDAELINELPGFGEEAIEKDAQKIMVTVYRDTVDPGFEIGDRDNIIELEVEKDKLFDYFKRSDIPDILKVENPSSSDEELFNAWLDEYICDEVDSLYSFIGGAESRSFEKYFMNVYADTLDKLYQKAKQKGEDPGIYANNHFEEIADADDLVGFYIYNYGSDALKEWLKVSDSADDRSREVTRILKNLYPKESERSSVVSIDEVKEEDFEDKEFEDKCYEAYKLDWMMSHGMSLAGLFDTFKEYVRGCYDISIQEGEDLKDGYGVKLMEYALEAFNECEDPVWACKEEFLDAEFKDKEYMNSLFERMPDTDALKSRYQKYNA